ncbi:hypothetical protein KP509_11G004800 [Ceratopteris richardii]|nr:hypothetical protein KP509_11G004800 [Ceratopteris richardii]
MVGISLTLADKLKIARALTELGVGYIEGGWPGSNPKDAEFFSLCKAEIMANKTNTKLAAFGATRRKGITCDEDKNLQSLISSDADVITVVAKAWDEQVIKVIETSLEENLNMISDTVKYLKMQSKEVMVDAEHFFDGYLSNREYAMDCLKTAAKAGADVVVLCDTNGGTMPWIVEEVTREIHKALEPWPSVRIGIHTHNDTDMAVANSLAAVRGGATLVQGCMNGYGERTGNANLVSIIGNLQVKLKYRCIPSSTLSKLASVSSFVAEIAGQLQSPSQPFVGSNAFAHKGGIHVAAIRKMPESYNHMDPTLVGNKMLSVVSELSGRGNILDKAERAGLTIDKNIAGNVLARIKKMELEGCAFEGAGASVDMLIIRRGQHYKRPFQVLEFSVISSNRGTQAQDMNTDNEDYGNCQVNQAIVKVNVNGVDQITASEGIGPVDALSHALRNALEAHYPQLSQIELEDYKVRLLEPATARKGTLSTTRVTIEFTDSKGNKWTTVGAHSSIVEASFRALVDGLEFGIVNCSEEGCST